ncbi:PREDICTED: cancer/testis antigen family 45 member A10-like isoform X2 [Chinchilla lanigera]|uniref:cancer/testis antigen family 45 member A10-like isoform X2 n=1 Tax=Chinchilla lanigera TaxID=34839 RepID=UPI000695D9BF|nr:PREDICTED: cancer/testis antigen family 45 member A10-like isoform X2 [Chinchilla lanigera]
MEEPSGTSSRQLCQEMMTEPDKSAVQPDVDLEPVKDDSHPISPKRRCTVSSQPVIQEGGSEPSSEDWTISLKEEFKDLEEGFRVTTEALDQQSDNSSGDGEVGLPFSSSVETGIGVRGFSADASVIPVIPTWNVVSHQLTVSPQEMNADIKRQLMKGIRQFGRKYERIFKLLDQVQGPLEVKKQFVEFTIKEAARFKRRDLIRRLEKKLEEITAICVAEEEDFY